MKRNDFKLIKPDLSYKEELLKFLEEIKKFDKNLKWQYSDMGDIEEYGCYYEEWLKSIKNNSTEMFLMINEINEVIGMIDIRQNIDEYKDKYRGNIGASIRPSKRNKGYGKILLELALSKCRDFKMHKVVITCNEKNNTSRNLIENNGGIYIDSIKNKEDNIRIYLFNIQKLYK